MSVCTWPECLKGLKLQVHRFAGVDACIGVEFVVSIVLQCCYIGFGKHLPAMVNTIVKLQWSTH